MKRFFMMLSFSATISAAAVSHAIPKNFFAPDGFRLFHKTSEGARFLADFDGMTTDGDNKIIWVRMIEPELPGNKHSIEYATEYQHKTTCSSDKIFMIKYAVYRSSGEEINSQIVNTDTTIVQGMYQGRTRNFGTNLRALIGKNGGFNIDSAFQFER